jgi:hypothetical protein
MVVPSMLGLVASFNSSVQLGYPLAQVVFELLKFLHVIMVHPTVKADVVLLIVAQGKL